MIESDLDEALMVGGSPVKAALEVTRILRDQLRDVIEFGGLSLESYIDFQSNVRGRINRFEAGPPPLRSQQLLALLDAGVVKTPFGPYPEVTAVDGEVKIRSTKVEEEVTVTVKGVVRGHLDLPSLARSSSPLLSRLHAKGRLTQMSYGDTVVGSVAISEDFHPYDAEGRLQSNLTSARCSDRGRALLHALSPVTAESTARGPRRSTGGGEHHRLTSDTRQFVALVNA